MQSDENVVIDNKEIKWVELNIILTDYTKFNDVLKKLVVPYINKFKETGKLLSWHFFREPHLCWRILSDALSINDFKLNIDKLLNVLEKEKPEIYKNHYYGAFCQEGKEYIDESELYGKDAMGLCYKRWESGSDLALLLCTANPEKTIPFHYTRDIHLFENQLGLDYSDIITIYLKWLKILMNGEPINSYGKYIPILDSMIKETLKPSRIKGI
jgi:hypothetical protein